MSDWQPPSTDTSVDSDSGWTPPAGDQTVNTAPAPASWGSTFKAMLGNPRAALDTLGYASSRTPTGRIQSGLDTAGNYIAEKGGQMGVPGAVAGTAGGIVANAPALLGAATSAGPLLGKWAGELADTAPGQFTGRMLVNETGGGGGPVPGNPPSTPPATPPLSSGAPNYFEQKGGANLNYSAGIRGKTIEMMTPPGHNPGTVGINLAKRMADEGALGNTPIDTFDKMSGVANRYGQGVGASYKAIDEANQAAGGEAGDALKIDANSHLKPILDEANKLRDLRNYPEQIKIGRYLYKTYSRLSDVANAGDGNLTLNDVHDELQQVGKLYSGTNDNIIDPIYSRLIKLQNDMVSDVADRAADPRLVDNLLKNNEGYSTYMRLLPDVRRAAAGMATGQQNMSSFLTDITGALKGQGPLGGRFALGLGRGAATAGESASGLTLPAKYAGSVLARPPEGQ